MGWLWKRLEGKLPPTAANQLVTTNLRLDEEGADGTCQGVSSNGNFTVKSAYSLSLNNESTTVDTVWRLSTTRF